MGLCGKPGFCGRYMGYLSGDHHEDISLVLSHSFHHHDSLYCCAPPAVVNDRYREGRFRM